MAKAAGGKSLLMGLAIGSMVLASMSIASAETASSFNKKVSGINTTCNGTDLFGFTMKSNTVRIGSADYKVNSIREFVLLYGSDPTPAPRTLQTGYIGNIGSKKRWTSTSSTAGTGAFYGWETSTGTAKSGQFKPTATGLDTGNVFGIPGPLTGQAKSKLTGFGWDISLLISAGQVDPFSGQRVCHDTTSTGFVYAPVPEPAMMQLGTLFLLGGIGYYRKKSHKA